MLRSLTIAQRALSGFSVVALLVVGLGAYALGQLSGVRAETENINELWIPSIVSIGEMRSDMQRIRALTLRQLLLTDERDIRASRAIQNEVESSLEDALKAYSSKILPDEHEDRAMFDKVENAWGDLQTTQHEILRLLDQGRRDEAIALVQSELLLKSDKVNKEALS